jgi:flagellar biosynthesis protein FliR
MAGVMVVDIAEYKSLQATKRMVYFCCVVLVLMFGAIMYLIGALADNYKMLKEFKELQRKTEVTQQEQQILAQSFIKGFEHQTALAGALLTWEEVKRETDRAHPPGGYAKK